MGKRGKDDGMQGEGNYAADRRYRRGVEKTLSEMSEEERAEQARGMTDEEKREAEKAESKGKKRARASE